MAGINTSPSMGFMGRMKQNLPGALNMAGSMMPGPFGQTSKIAGALMRPRPQGTNPEVQGRQTTVHNGPQGMPPTGPSPFNTAPGRGIVRGPSQFQLPPGGVMGPNGLPRNGNTGFTGGMGGMFGGMFKPEPQFLPMQPPDMHLMGGGSGGNLWQNYMGGINRPMFY